MAPSVWTPSITVRVPFGSTQVRRNALLTAAGVPLDDDGEATRGFLHERGPSRFGGDSICRWFSTDGAESAPATTAARHVPAPQGLR
ncbi:hypothetical protein ABIC90_001476 [Variovorax boronicumulans]